MPKALFVTLRVIVDDLPPALRPVFADDNDTPLAELPGLAETTAAQVGEAVAAILDGAGDDDQLFLGTDVNLRLVHAEVTGAEWA